METRKKLTSNDSVPTSVLPVHMGVAAEMGAVAFWRFWKARRSRAAPAVGVGVVVITWTRVLRTSELWTLPPALATTVLAMVLALTMTLALALALALALVLALVLALGGLPPAALPGSAGLTVMTEMEVTRDSNGKE